MQPLRHATDLRARAILVEVNARREHRIRRRRMISGRQRWPPGRRTPRGLHPPEGQGASGGAGSENQACQRGAHCRRCAMTAIGRRGASGQGKQGRAHQRPREVGPCQRRRKQGRTSGEGSRGRAGYEEERACRLVGRMVRRPRRGRG
jgi:hypothetical protein